MVVPDSAGEVQPAGNDCTGGLMKTSQQSYEEEQELAGVELEEVRKLQELIRRLEVQNQTLRNRGDSTKNLHLRGATTTNSNLTTSTNINERISSSEEVTNTNSPLRLGSSGSCGTELGSSSDLELSPPQDSSSSEDMSPLPAANRIEDADGGLCAGFLTLPCGNGPGPAPTQGLSTTPESPSLDSYESETLAESDSGVDPLALDEVDVLDLWEDLAEVDDEDSWLYVSPKKQVVAEPRPESPLKWCRKVLDHPSPETEVACRTLLNRLDQSTHLPTSRWRNIYSSSGQTGEAGSSGSGLLSPGYHNKSTNKILLTSGGSGYMSMYSALSSQSSVDSELSTSDDSITMGYKLQDLTDVQIMARLQEESLRQDYASSSASVSRRSSSASLQSLRRGGTYSDQEFDTYSLEDEEDECCSLPQRRLRYSPSPLGSPRCLSPSPGSQGQAEYSRLGAPRQRAPRRSLQGPGPELLKFAKTEEEVRHSMPNLAPRTSLRSLEAVRNSRSMEANLQSSGNRISHLPHSPSSGMSSSRMRGSGQSPLSMRVPVKAMGSMPGARQPSRVLPVVQSGPNGGVRRVQSPGPANGGAYPAGRASTGGGRQAAAPSSRGRLAQTPRRSMGMTRTNGPISNESWRDGCY
ncbi:SLAIN motif-containing protein-like isoform X1 [Oncorhynchus mykiss]|uniref:SLAIN motif-containing protein-like n=1 Tax=Oncorhynchus mykiss TaxID=8022 RepID=A0A8C7R2Y5_ONCMY|nr:SLAIN motif-containing protein-like isoform X1 [Oncorhynchus mykiss]XP_021417412.2 SLAIN motif-containing protein-like isoform X1 [Oncorhynchus mykiss]